jgi:hypothetical protein
MVEHVVFIKTHSAPLEWTDSLRRIVGDPIPVLKEDSMFYVGVPAFLPFTHALLAMSHLPIEIVDISGHEALQVKVSCPPSTGKVFESDMKSQCVPGSRILFRFQYPKGSLDDRWHFAVGFPASSLYLLGMRSYLFHPTFGQVLVDVAYLLGFLRFVSIQLSSRWPKVEIAQATQPHEFAAPRFRNLLFVCRFLTHGTTQTLHPITSRKCALELSFLCMVTPAHFFRK